MIKSSSSALVTLSPKMINGLICVGGRLCRASVDDHAKHPIIVPYKHHVTDIIISSVHLAVGHMGQESVLSALRPFSSSTCYQKVCHMSTTTQEKGATVHG
ncbi:hypothetical protein SNE40_019843 [Patella caerulea]|uniref:Integrase zinc-binding domain-containing protein n=1 Tax=Patella caerulea TaxID=87958 RepID=A0AAN8GD65_PATCE